MWSCYRPPAPELLPPPCATQEGAQDPEHVGLSAAMRELCAVSEPGSAREEEPIAATSTKNTLLCVALGLVDDPLAHGRIRQIP